MGQITEKRRMAGKVGAQEREKFTRLRVYSHAGSSESESSLLPSKFSHKRNLLWYIGA